MVSFVILVIPFLSLVSCHEYLNGQIYSQEIRTRGVIECDPLFIKGTIQDAIDSLMVYPNSALKDSVQGVVFINCWVEIDGNTSSCEILKGVREDLDEEALRIGNLLRFDEPARHRGKPVKIEFPIAVKFTLKTE